MTVAELIDKLSEFDLDAEVRLAFQPSWAMQYAVADVASGLDEEDGGEPGPGAVYIAEGGQPFDDPYLPPSVAFMLGWRNER